MKKILIINTVPFTYNGISQVIINYFSLMPKDDLDISIVAFSVKNEEIPVEVLEPLKGATIFKVPNRKVNVIGYIKKLNKIMRENNFDLVHINGNSNTMSLELILAKMHNIPERITHVHNISCQHKILSMLLTPVFNLYCTKRLACSQLAGERLFKEKPFIVFNNAIDLKKYRFNSEVRQKYRKELNLENKFVMGHIGLVNEQKNHSFLLDVFYETTKLRDDAMLLLISGSMDLTQELKTKIKRLGLTEKVIFMSKRKDVHKLLQAMDVFVFPSKYEGLGLALIEAQASGLPCIAADTVPKEAKATSIVKFLSLDSGPENWAKECISFSKQSVPRCNAQVTDLLTEAGYSIEDNAEILYYIYKGKK
ncbi:MAG TPA: glycosyltransferase family 1 protein [Peptococcaceae bacterium]|nr:glycosyltransferase family 1 protein [Peptococcaceae bacterium]